MDSLILTSKQQTSYKDEINHLIHTSIESRELSFINLAKNAVNRSLIDIPKLRSEILYGKGFTLIKNLPSSAYLPSTPNSGKRPHKKELISEAVILGIMSALKFSPFSYKQEKRGAIVQEISPVKSKHDTYSSNGIKEFDFHSDASFLCRSIRPHVLGLMCLRDVKGTSTKLVRLGDILDNLPQSIMNVLMKDKFIHSPPESFSISKNQRKPIISRVDDKLEIAISFSNIKAVDDESDHALKILRGIIDLNYIEINWQIGDLLIINNLRCLHGRGEIKGDRWLQRCYGNENMKTSFRVDLE